MPCISFHVVVNIFVCSQEFLTTKLTTKMRGKHLIIRTTKKALPRIGMGLFFHQFVATILSGTGKCDVGAP